MSARLRSSVAWAAQVAAIAAGESVLVWSRGVVQDPLPLGPELLDADPYLAGVALIRAVALLAGAVVLAAAAVRLVADLAGAPDLARAAGCWTIPSLRGTLARTATTGLALSLALGPVPADAEGPAPAPTHRLTRLPDAAPGPRLHRLPDDPPSPETTTPGQPPSISAPTTARQPPSGQADTAADRIAPQGTVVIAPGDSFWRVAEREVAARLGRPPSDREVGAYWVQLVDANEHRLPVPGNPDLLFPGSVVDLPAGA